MVIKNNLRKKLKFWKYFLSYAYIKQIRVQEILTKLHWEGKQVSANIVLHRYNFISLAYIPSKETIRFLLERYLSLIKITFGIWNEPVVNLNKAGFLKVVFSAVANLTHSPLFIFQEKRILYQYNFT